MYSFTSATSTAVGETHSTAQDTTPASPYVAATGLNFPPPPIRPLQRATPPATLLAAPFQANPDRADIYEALTALDDALDTVSLNSSSGVHSTCSSLSSSSNSTGGGRGGGSAGGSGTSGSNYGSDTSGSATLASQPVRTPATLRKPARSDYACVLDTLRTPCVESTPPPPPPHDHLQHPPNADTPAAIALPSPPAARHTGIAPPTLPKSSKTPAIENTVSRANSATTLPSTS